MKCLFVSGTHSEISSSCWWRGLSVTPLMPHGRQGPASAARVALVPGPGDARFGAGLGPGVSQRALRAGHSRITPCRAHRPAAQSAAPAALAAAGLLFAACPQTVRSSRRCRPLGGDPRDLPERPFRLHVDVVLRGPVWPPSVTSSRPRSSKKFHAAADVSRNLTSYRRRARRPRRSRRAARPRCRSCSPRAPD